MSARAARTGSGGWDLSEASGSLDVDYETLGVLGRGNFSEVNLLRHRATRELRALKFCCKLDAPSYSHLRAETAMASRVSHPFVLSPLSVCDSAGRAGNFSVLLPLCPGGDLLQLMRRQAGGALGEPAARSYAAMVALGLGALHLAGLAYRDLKPENLLLDAGGYLRICDFGFTATLSECRKKGTAVGTAMYQAPELLRKQPHGFGVDWWALGCLLIEMVRGASPFAGDGDEDTEAAVLAHAGGVPPPKGEVAAEPSAALNDLCGRLLLEPAPAERLGADGRDAAAEGGPLRAHAWFDGFDWSGCLEMTAPAPSVPPPLPEQTDELLLELTKRCQQGFDF